MGVKSSSVDIDRIGICHFIYITALHHNKNIFLLKSSNLHK